MGLNLVVSRLDGETKQLSSLQEVHKAVIEDNVIFSRANMLISFSFVL